MIKINNPLLESLGLSEMQAKVYLANLELGQASMQDLARKSGVKRTSIYNFIDQLKEKQLIKETKKGKRNFYSAASPEKFIQLNKERADSLNNLLPQLMAIFNQPDNKPKVTFHQGWPGIKDVYLDTLKEKKPIVAWSDYQPMKNIMKDFYQEYPAERSRRNITFKTIASDNLTGREIAKKNLGHLREIKFIKQDLDTEINIYGNKVALISFKSPTPFAVLIEDEKIANTLKVIWQLQWQQLPD
ncbi:MAG: hypothetical protein JW816_04075 [Candidatus Buchananbacteria bacterium]|nr:hypothetical protein [Candidatus Buchananbacteria bacterium]